MSPNDKVLMSNNSCRRAVERLRRPHTIHTMLPTDYLTAPLQDTVNSRSDPQPDNSDSGWLRGAFSWASKRSFSVRRFGFAPKRVFQDDENGNPVCIENLPGSWVQSSRITLETPSGEPSNPSSAVRSSASLTRMLARSKIRNANLRGYLDQTEFKSRSLVVQEAPVLPPRLDPDLTLARKPLPCSPGRELPGANPFDLAVGSTALVPEIPSALRARLPTKPTAGPTSASLHSPTCASSPVPSPPSIANLKPAPVPPPISVPQYVFGRSLPPSFAFPVPTVAFKNVQIPLAWLPYINAHFCYYPWTLAERMLFVDLMRHLPSVQAHYRKEQPASGDPAQWNRLAPFFNHVRRAFFDASPADHYMLDQHPSPKR